MSKPTSLPPDDTYFIYATLEAQKVYLEFNDGSQGTNLTTWQFDGNSDQQVRSLPATSPITYCVIDLPNSGS